MSEKPPSERQQLAQRIADFINANRLNNPFGGDVHQSAEKKGRPYTILFSRPRYLDGLVTVYGPKFILINSQGGLALNDGAVFESEENALNFMRLAFVEETLKRDEAMEIPVKAQKAA